MSKRKSLPLHEVLIEHEKLQACVRINTHAASTTELLRATKCLLKHFEYAVEDSAWSNGAKYDAGKYRKKLQTILKELEARTEV